jgi:hypothetical protein
MPTIKIEGEDGPEEVHLLRAEEEQPMSVSQIQTPPAQQKSRLLVGLVLGLILGAAITAACAGRFQIYSAGSGGFLTLKLDRWTGEVRRYDRSSNTWMGTHANYEAAIDAIKVAPPAKP